MYKRPIALAVNTKQAPRCQWETRADTCHAASHGLLGPCGGWNRRYYSGVYQAAWPYSTHFLVGRQVMARERDIPKPTDRDFLDLSSDAHSPSNVPTVLPVNAGHTRESVATQLGMSDSTPEIRHVFKASRTVSFNWHIS